MTPQAAAKELRARARAVTPAGKTAQRLTLKVMKAQARTASSGPFRSAQLAKMGRPYSKRRPRPPQDRAILNRQSGRLLNGWRTVVGVNVAGRLEGSLFNIAPEARWFDDRLYPRGTKWAIARPIQNYLRSKVRRLYAINVELLMRYALKA